jgi:hypothetical protein
MFGCGAVCRCGRGGKTSLCCFVPTDTGCVHTSRRACGGTRPLSADRANSVTEARGNLWGLEVELHAFLTLACDRFLSLGCVPQATCHRTHWTAQWVGPRACLDAEESNNKLIERPRTRPRPRPRLCVSASWSRMYTKGQGSGGGRLLCSGPDGNHGRLSEDGASCLLAGYTNRRPVLPAIP